MIEDNRLLRMAGLAQLSGVHRQTIHSYLRGPRGRDDELLRHDVLEAEGIPIQSFNAHALRMIASSHKKTDKHDAYWIAKALHSGMTPPAVCIPYGRVRRMRQLLSER